METIIWLTLFMGTGLTLAYRAAGLQRSTATVGALLIIYTLFGPAGALFKLACWAAFGLVACAFNVESLRREWLTAPAFALLKRILPEISATERTALDAGTVWWEGDLFRGNPNWAKFRAIRIPTLSRAERDFLDGPATRLCRMLDEWDITHQRADLPPKVWDYLKAERFFGMIIPTEYGGLGFSAGAHSAVLARIGSTPAGMVASSIVAVPNSLGPAELLLKYGTDEQKTHYLPRLATGDDIPCFALTSPHAGSDAGSIPDTGIVCRGEWNGEQVLGMRLTWDKRYITLAPVATVLGLAVQLRDPDKLLGDRTDVGITCCLIPVKTPGVEIGRRHFPLNAPFMNGPTRGQDVFVPLDMIIGGAEMAGQGWRMLMECLSVGRAISLPSGSTGASLGMARATGAYARIREQFSQPIGQFEGVQEALARIAGRTYASNAVRRLTAGAVDLGEKPSVPSAIAKYHCTHMSQRNAIDAMDVHAGKGVMLGPRNWVARHYQAAPVSITVEGANILTRSMMIFGQGAMRCHPFALREIEAIGRNDINAFDALLLEHVGHVLGCGARALALGLSGSRLAAAPEPSPVPELYQQISRYSAALGLLSDVCMASLGGSLKFRESISGRMGDVLSQLYIASAALKQFEDDGEPVEDIALVSWVCQSAFVEIEAALDGVLRNLPNRLLAATTRLLIFPLGRRAAPPSDALGQRLAQLLQEPGEARDRLTAAAFISGSREHATGLLDQTLAAVLDTETIARRVRKAFRDARLGTATPDERLKQALESGIITAEEGERLGHAQALVAEVIAVDDFPTSQLAVKKPRARTPSKSRKTKTATS